MLGMANVLMLLLALAPWGEDGSTPPRNVVILLADDLGWEIGCNGSGWLPTPSLDRLAAQGTRFTHAFTTTASCSVSRSVIYTGLHHHANGQYGHANFPHGFSQHPFVRPIFSLVKAKGYRTGLIGKKHVGPAEKYVVDFEPRVNPRDVEAMAEHARSFFSGNESQPFLLVIGFADPHREGAGFPRRRALPNGRTPIRPHEVVVPPFLPDIPEVREELAGYSDMVARLDHGIGLVLDALETTGRANDTLVLFTSDNGIPFPGAKTTLYDAGIRLPFIVRLPRQSPRGVVNSAMISFVDIVPTLLEWTQAQGPDYRLHGRSFLPIVSESKPNGWDEVGVSSTFHEVTMCYPVRGVRTREFKCLWNLTSPQPFPHAADLFDSKTWQAVRKRGVEQLGGRSRIDYIQRPRWELYDLRNDPHEFHNVASDPKYKDAFARLRQKVFSLQRSTNDPWEIEQRDEPSATGH